MHGVDLFEHAGARHSLDAPGTPTRPEPLYRRIKSGVTNGKKTIQTRAYRTAQ